ncbi:hypothetical protein F4604DRAFT_1690247 [Suillus subluteus]|nr:hypothetical protein F4604DRAFT_1690247 [Suillus subluteus]
MDNLKSRTTELSATLGRRVAEIMGNSSELGVLKEGSIETELLHKARMRIAVQLRQCLESSGDNLTFDDGSISEYEIDWAALTIAHAMVNPINIDWDVDRQAQKNLSGLPPKYFDTFSHNGSAKVVGYYVDGCTKTSGLMYWYYFVDRWAEGVVKDLLYTDMMELS